MHAAHDTAGDAYVRSFPSLSVDTNVLAGHPLIQRASIYIIRGTVILQLHANC